MTSQLRLCSSSRAFTHILHVLVRYEGVCVGVITVFALAEFFPACPNPDQTWQLVFTEWSDVKITL